MNSIKNKPFLCAVSMKNLPNYHNFFRRRYKHISSFTLEYQRQPTYLSRESDKTIQRKLLKLVKHIKDPKALRLLACQLQNYNSSKSIYLAKRMSRVTELSLSEYISLSITSIHLSFWLKHMKNLVKLEYLVIQQLFAVNVQDSKDFERIVKQLFSMVRRSKVQIFNIKQLAVSPKILNAFSNFQYYPSSLKKLSFQWKETFQLSPAPVQQSLDSLSHMKRLRAISFDFTNQAARISSVLKSITALPQLTSVCINLPPQKSQALFPHLYQLSKLHQLTKLKIKATSLPDDIEPFLRSLSELSLTAFGFSFEMTNSNQLIAIQAFIARQKELEDLQINIQNDSLFKKEDLEALFNQISLLSDLSALKLNLSTNANVLKRDILSSCLLNSLNDTFTKSVPIEAFSFFSNQFDPSQAFKKIISLLSNQTDSLKKLTISVGDYGPLKADYSLITNFVRDIHSIQILRLESLSVPLNQLLQELLQSISTLKYIRTIVLGEVKGNVAKQGFIDAVEHILTKRGIRKFFCGTSRAFQKTLAKRISDDSKIDLDEVKRRNPSLQHPPIGLPIFSSNGSSNLW